MCTDASVSDDGSRFLDPNGFLIAGGPGNLISPNGALSTDRNFSRRMVYTSMGGQVRISVLAKVKSPAGSDSLSVTSRRREPMISIVCGQFLTEGWQRYLASSGRKASSTNRLMAKTSLDGAFVSDPIRAGTQVSAASIVRRVLTAAYVLLALVDRPRGSSTTMPNILVVI
jgi:hypothetical protein